MNITRNKNNKNNRNYGLKQLNEAIFPKQGDGRTPSDVNKKAKDLGKEIASKLYGINLIDEKDRLHVERAVAQVISNYKGIRFFENTSIPSTGVHSSPSDDTGRNVKPHSFYPNALKNAKKILRNPNGVKYQKQGVVVKDKNNLFKNETSPDYEE